MRYAVALGLLLCACRSIGDRYQVHIDPAFTAEEVDMVGDALDEWAARVPAHFDTTLSYCTGDRDGHICMHPGDPQTHGCVIKSAGGATEAGCTDDTSDAFGPIDGHNVYLLPLVDAVRRHPYTFQNMARHELGHAMWLMHSKEAGAIMCATVSCEGEPGRISDNDVAQWWEVRR